MGLSKNSYYRGLDWTIQAGVLLLLVVAPFAGKGNSLYLIGQAVAMLGLIGVCAMDMSRPYLARLAATTFGVMGLALSAAILRKLVGGGGPPFGEVSAAFFTDGALIVVPAMIVLNHTDSPVMQRVRQHPRLATVIGCAVAFIVLMLMAAMLSPDPPHSLRWMRKEMGAYFLLFLITIHTIKTWARFRRAVVVAFVVGALACATGVLCYAVYLYCDRYEMQQVTFWMADPNQGFLVRHPNADSGGWLQAQFPFEHPNRLGSFGVLFVMLSAVIFTLGGSWKARSWIVAGGLISLLAIVLSGTRGAMVAAVGGVAVCLVLWDKRLLIPLVIGSVVFALSFNHLPIPEKTKERISSIFDITIYTEHVDTMSWRQMMWKASGAMIADHPWWGIGYGKGFFKSDFDSYRVEGDNDPEEKNHPHNNFLYLGVSSGIPALTAFVLFLTLLMSGCLRRYWRPLDDVRGFREMAAALFALWIAFILYSMTNTSLRYTIGMWTWLLMGLTVAFIQLSAHPAMPQKRPAK